VVSSGLLDHLRGRHVRAVLAHELSHVANGDMVTLALIQGVLNTFVLVGATVVGLAVDRTIFRNERGCGPAYWTATLLADLLLGALATAIVMAFSRRREFRADADAASRVGSRRMIDALHHLQSHSRSELPRSLRAFGIHGSGWRWPFSSHPSLQVRINRLRAVG
jgi:heat shock protein HtpX